MRITCPACKNEHDLSLYFYDAQINKIDDPVFCNSYAVARCRAKAICTTCGQEIQEYYEREIPKSIIIKLATGEEV